MNLQEIKELCHRVIINRLVLMDKFILMAVVTLIFQILLITVNSILLLTNVGDVFKVIILINLINARKLMKYLDVYHMIKRH